MKVFRAILLSKFDTPLSNSLSASSSLSNNCKTPSEIRLELQALTLRKTSNIEVSQLETTWNVVKVTV